MPKFESVCSPLRGCWHALTTAEGGKKNRIEHTVPQRLWNGKAGDIDRWEPSVHPATHPTYTNLPRPSGPALAVQGLDVIGAGDGGNTRLADQGPASHAHAHTCPMATPLHTHPACTGRVHLIPVARVCACRRRPR